MFAFFIYEFVITHVPFSEDEVPVDELVAEIVITDVARATFAVCFRILVISHNILLPLELLAEDVAPECVEGNGACALLWRCVI